ncbi:MAG: glycerol kinase GlpK [Deltaproteobacteria bacterium]|nr:glycerol kinase GlpK [Deltaproteobacteria bacterium]MBW1922645.1 glycerol kinase GlpK [Deltaproteobacteria bacterium]MBW1948716.1 glycerol kinase GlpK [Deltaproteobacteria bacterium]MBW2008079.1 glycerol kinase GlpK [Deltaproteobacteria bacterium]MBW2346871.1 glycerol kinase GlpK [Deltaproteobacteria bacterium]
MGGWVGAVDQGTTSTRFMIFDRRGRVGGMAQKEHRQIFPRPGWVEHDPMEIWRNTVEVVSEALASSGIRGGDLEAVGITNQRETTVVWDRATGKPFSNAIVWQCTRTEEICRKLAAEGMEDRFREKTGLPVATYFSGPKIRWVLDHHPEARRAAREGRACFGTIDSWLIWRLTGGPGKGTHVTDVTNASRTMLMDLRSLQWDREILDLMEIPEDILPRIVPSSDGEPWGYTREEGPFGARIPVCGAVGDQQAALVGQTCFREGDAKNTYGTGCFLLLNTGSDPRPSAHGLITTVGYQVSGQAPVYSLEGSVAVAGALVQWLRDNLGLISTASEVEDLARSVKDNGGVYIVPAFSGLFAPYWRPDARGVITGLTRYADKGHLARAALEAVAYQTRDIVDAMEKDSGVSLKRLKVDGGMVANELLMQFQSNILGVPVIRPRVSETTALGAAYMAGLAVGFWKGLEELQSNWYADKTWRPAMGEEERRAGYRGWKKAVERSLGWI